MKHSVLLSTLQNLMQFKPRQADLCKILNFSYSTIAARAARDSEYSNEEIEKIEAFYGIDFGLSNNCIELDYYTDIKASCGYGIIIPDEHSIKLKVSKDTISNYSPNKNYSVINAYGDSMEPYIQNNDKLIVEHIDDNQIKDGRIYIFRYDNELYIKELVNNITQVIARSINSAYKPVTLDKKAEDFKIIGQIVGLIRDLR